MFNVPISVEDLKAILLGNFVKFYVHVREHAPGSGEAVAVDHSGMAPPGGWRSIIQAGQKNNERNPDRLLPTSLGQRLRSIPAYFSDSSFTLGLLYAVGGRTGSMRTQCVP